MPPVPVEEDQQPPPEGVLTTGNVEAMVSPNRLRFFRRSSSTAMSARSRSSAISATSSSEAGHRERLPEHDRRGKHPPHLRSEKQVTHHRIHQAPISGSDLS